MFRPARAAVAWSPRKPTAAPSAHTPQKVALLPSWAELRVTYKLDPEVVFMVSHGAD